MSSRMDKYSFNDIENDENKKEYETPSFGSRSRKNEELYQVINHEEYGDINLTSNAHVIGDNNKNIDIEKIKEILEKNYREEPRKSRVMIKKEEEEPVAEEQKEEKEETKEYNINAIIAKAKKEKNVDYEKERLKKVRDTQYDILKGLKLEEKKEEDEEESKVTSNKEESKVTSNKEDLLSLINTITEQELTREMNPLDILTDLKGSENTVVLDGIKEEINKKEAEEKEQEIEKKPKENEKEEPKVEEEKKDMDKTFYTNSISFSKSDFDDFNDLKENVETNKILIKVVLIIITIALIAGILFFANEFFHLNWF